MLRSTIRDMHSVRQPGLLVVRLVEELRKKTEIRGLDTRWSHWDISLNMVLGSTQPLAEMSTRYISWG